MENFKRGLSDEQFQKTLDLCVSKIEKTNDLDWQDIVEQMELGVHRDVLRKAFQAPFGGYAILKFLEEKKTKELDKDILNELEEKEIELKKIKVRIADQQRKLNSFVRWEARWDELRDTIIEEAKNSTNNKPSITNIPFINSTENPNKACLILSDLHIGSEIDTYTNKFNIEIAKERLNVLLSKTIEYCKLHNVNELNVELLGDLVSGNIHVSTRLYNEENVIKQTMVCAEILADFIKKLAATGIIINIYFSVGNHGRVSANYKEHICEENFEYLIKWHLEGALSEKENVFFKDNVIDDEIAIIEVFDKKIASVHGHKDKPKIALNKLTRFTNIMIDEVHMAHFHNFQVSDGVLINGCLSGADKYAQNLRFNNKASQVLKVYYNDGNECIHNIVLN